ncbi:uncharacterized protein DEA37_0000931, partial [Paragonimus westermani]
MASDRNVEQRDRSVVSEFCHLLEKSKQLLNGLRDLPQHGHKQWKAYFWRTFDVYTKLRKFQQQYRLKPDELCRLKRWQMGEVASKIDGIRAPSVKYGDEPHTNTVRYDSGGVVTNNRREQEFNVNSKHINFKESHCMHPGDIYPYMRKSPFLVVDSDNSNAFRTFSGLFGQPFVCILSPEVIPD